LGVRPPRPDWIAGGLSGGNQQKVALARWLTHLPKVLILNEPTRGMDVGAKEDVVNIVRSIRKNGVAVILVSTEPELILALSDRIVVMQKGRSPRSSPRKRSVKTAFSPSLRGITLWICCRTMPSSKEAFRKSWVR
jgi:ribose transport system ATP-binding protein